jgi:hypothetical protein
VSATDHDGAGDDELVRLASHTLKETKEALDWHPANGVFTSEPEPLRRPLPPAEPYPMQALGDVLGAAAERIRDVLRVPDAIAGQSMFAAASLAVQAHADVLIDGRREPLSLWHLTIGESGERKTACDVLALRQHREHEKAMLRAYENDKASHAIDVAAFECASRSASKAKEVGAIRDELERLGPAPVAPRKPLLLVSTPTIEAIHKQLIEGLPSIGLFHDDAGEFLGGHSMRQEHRIKTAASLSKLWDCGEFDRIRAADGGSKHYGKRLALHLMIQPVIAEMVLSDDVLTGQGFLARGLLCWPTSTIGTRGYVETDLSGDAAMLNYWKCVGESLTRKPALQPDTRNELAPRCLSLTPEAKRRWIGVYNAIETDMTIAGDYSSVRAWASKAPAQVLRIAGVMTLIERPDCGTIGIEQIDRAALLVNHHLAEAVRIIGTNSVPKAIRDAENLLAWCRENKIQFLHSALALQKGPNCIRSRANFDAAVAELERCGWLLSMQGGVELDGRVRRRVWIVRPT